MKQVIAALLEYRRVRNQLRVTAKFENLAASDILINRLASKIRSEEDTDDRGHVIAVYAMSAGCDLGYETPQPFHWMRASVLHEDRHEYRYEIRDYVRVAA